MALITQASAGVVPGFKEVAGVSHPGGAETGEKRQIFVRPAARSLPKGRPGKA